MVAVGYLINRHTKRWKIYITAGFIIYFLLEVIAIFQASVAGPSSFAGAEITKLLVMMLFMSVLMGLTKPVPQHRDSAKGENYERK